MADFTKTLLSGCSGGQMLTLTGTTWSNATLLHTAIAGTTGMDEIWLWAMNNSVTDATIIVAWGHQSHSSIIQTISGQSGLQIVAPGLLLNKGFSVWAYGGTGNVIQVLGFVNRIA